MDSLGSLITEKWTDPNPKECPGQVKKLAFQKKPAADSGQSSPRSNWESHVSITPPSSSLRAPLSLFFIYPKITQSSPYHSTMSSTSQSQSSADAFSLRIVTLDYYMSPPIPNLDFLYSSFQGNFLYSLKLGFSIRGSSSLFA